MPTQQSHGSKLTKTPPIPLLASYKRKQGSPRSKASASPQYGHGTGARNHVRFQQSVRAGACSRSCAGGEVWVVVNIRGKLGGRGYGCYANQINTIKVWATTMVKTIVGPHLRANTQHACTVTTVITRTNPRLKVASPSVYKAHVLVPDTRLVQTDFRFASKCISHLRGGVVRHRARQLVGRKSNRLLRTLVCDEGGGRH